MFRLINSMPAFFNVFVVFFPPLKFLRVLPARLVSVRRGMAEKSAGRCELCGSSFFG